MNIHTVLPILSLMAGIALSLTFGFPLFLGIVLAILVTLVSVKRLGYSWRKQWNFGWEGVKQTKPVLMILFLVGLLIPLLMMGGTIPAIIFYGLSIVDVKYMLILSYLLASAASYLLGTSVGTLSTVGLALMGIAHTAGIPAAMVAGALISGAMVGERFSPISSSRLLILSSLDMTEKEDRSNSRTAWLAVAICGVMFLTLDLFRSEASDTGVIGQYQQLLQQVFAIGWLPLVPLLVLIGSFAFRVKAVPALLYGLLSAALLVLATVPIEPAAMGRSILYGYELHTGTPLDQLVHGGGMLAILEVLVLITLAGFLNGILNRANLLAPLVEGLIGKTEHTVVLAGKAVLLSLLVVIISCNQTIPILVMSSTLLPRFSRMEQGHVFLGRTMLDSTLVLPVLIPWNGLAMVMSVTLGVPTVQILPYLFFSFVLPVLTIITARRFQASGSPATHKKAM
ncbi:sodium:proton antiporter [Brevibacillus ruminantium]|uniref:Sodium:proton antiporter n=1 Tax=Brevibacillus ruminantium TaxID=2950604 RepID=A0ABY4WDJ1_9BACL|nr:Na+/H+ antiporter NhaC family protein [Brevibacillus ruminantium]USG65235.1 sodium:proton antiporter [Brevibacillus ruminantium]